MNWFERYFTPACDIARTAPAEASPMFDGVRVNGTTYTCSRDATVPNLYRCASWAEAQGLADALSMAIVVTVMGDNRLLTPGGASASGVVRTDSTPAEAIANALALRPGGVSPEGVVAIIGAGAAVAVGAAWFFLRGKKKRSRRGRRRR